MHELLALLLNSATIIKPSYDFLVTAKGAYDSYQQKKTRLFIEDVFRNVKNVTIHDVHKNDILHNFYMTLDCIQKVRRQEQLKHFAEILQTYLQDDRLQLPDYNDNVHNNYELVMNMLTGLSYIEFELLILLYKFEKPYRDAGIKVKSKEYWDDKFMPEVQAKFGFDFAITYSIFQTLHAKGMFYINGAGGEFAGSDIRVGTLSNIFIMIVSYMPSIKSQ